MQNSWFPFQMTLRKSAISVLLLIAAEAVLAQSSASASGPFQEQGNCISNSADHPVGSATARAMYASANNAYNRSAQIFDQTAINASNATSRGMGCVEETVRALNEIIPTFGGGLVGEITGKIVNSLASQACQVIARTTQQATNAANQAINQVTNIPSSVLQNTIPNIQYPQIQPMTTPPIVPDSGGQGGQGGQSFLDSVSKTLSKIF